MRGKKTDIDFMEKFVLNCAMKNKISSEDICQEAQREIDDIDNEIKKIEQLKIRRSKVIDIIYTFNNKQKDNSEQKKKLSYYEIKNKEIATLICKFVPSEINKIILNVKYDKNNVIFTIKQLLELRILSKNNNFLDKGLLFDDYEKFLVNYV